MLLLLFLIFLTCFLPKQLVAEVTDKVLDLKLPPSDDPFVPKAVRRLLVLARDVMQAHSQEGAVFRVPDQGHSEFCDPELTGDQGSWWEPLYSNRVVTWSSVQAFFPALVDGLAIVISGRYHWRDLSSTTDVSASVEPLSSPDTLTTAVKDSSSFSVSVSVEPKSLFFATRHRIKAEQGVKVEKNARLG